MMMMMMKSYDYIQLLVLGCCYLCIEKIGKNYTVTLKTVTRNTVTRNTDALNTVTRNTVTIKTVVRAIPLQHSTTFNNIQIHLLHTLNISTKYHDNIQMSSHIN